MDIAALLTPSLAVSASPGLAPPPPPPTPGPGLLSLPLELLAGIFEHVVAPLAHVEGSDLITMPHIGDPVAYQGDCKTARRTILNACLVCRQLHCAAREALYRNITLTSGQDIVYLLRTLLLSHSAHGDRNSDPLLPSLVRNMVCLVVLDDPENDTAAACTWNHVRPGLACLVRDGIGTAILKNLYLSLSGEEGPDTGLGVKERIGWTIQRLLAAVLALLPELRSLLIEDPSERYAILNACLGTLQENRQLRHHILPKFTKISTRTDGRRHRLGTVLSFFLRLDTTRTYNAHYGPEPLSLARYGQDVLPTRLESITMTCCVAPGLTLLTMVDSCSRLRHLKLHCLTWQQEDSDVFDNELPKLAPTLETLSLQGYFIDRGLSSATIRRKQGCSRLDCLPQMTNLAVLTISMSILVSGITEVEIYGIAHRLPPRLEHLTMLEETDLFPTDLAPIGRALLQAAWDCPQRLPRLRNFIYGRERVDATNVGNDPMELEIISRFASSGINFRLQSRTNNLESLSD